MLLQKNKRNMFYTIYGDDYKEEIDSNLCEKPIDMSVLG